MIGQYTQMEHIRVGKHYICTLSYISPLTVRCIAIESGYSLRGEKLGASYLLQAAQLILCQRFQGKH